MKYKCIIAVFVLGISLLPNNVNSQTVRYLNEMENKHQACLDNGINMLRCSKQYYIKVDSMLNVVYKGIRSRLNDSNKSGLKNKQLAWIRNRDIYFKKLILEVKAEGVTGDDFDMVLLDRKSDYVKERIVELIKIYGDIRTGHQCD